jgi:hypothetical protein
VEQEKDPGGDRATGTFQCVRERLPQLSRPELELPRLRERLRPELLPERLLPLLLPLLRRDCEARLPPLSRFFFIDCEDLFDWLAI